MNHRVINGLIISAVVLIGVVVLAALAFGPDLPTGDTDTASVSGDSESSDDQETEDDSDPGTATPEQPDPTPTATVTPSETVSGTVTDAGSGEPLPGVEVEVVDHDGLTATTGEDGSFRLDEVPADAVLAFSMDGYHAIEQPLEADGEADVALESSVLAGTVVNDAGEPIHDATVASGDALTSTAEDGTFQLENAPDEGEIVFKASGYRAQAIPIGELGDQIQMEPFSVKGLYATAGAVGDGERLTGLLDTIERTELNAIVIDIKDSAGMVFHDTGVEMAHEIGAVSPVYNAEQVLQEVKSRGIYAIARIVVFEDPVLAENRPELAIQDSQEGGVWTTFSGIPWTNPYQEGVWDYNIELMKEAVELGFDEVQFDYMRFPTDGPLNRADYGQESTAETRDQAIAGFLSRAYEEIAPTTAYLTGDIFGMSLWQQGEGEIGQDVTTVIDHLDYIHPMIYPSHFYEGSMGFEVPNDHPYEVILQSLEAGMAQTEPHQKPKFRPWLQDFSYGVGIDYGDAEVRAQIDAAEDFGASGWLLWNAAASYHEGALRPAE